MACHVREILDSSKNVVKSISAKPLIYGMSGVAILYLVMYLFYIKIFMV